MITDEYLEGVRAATANWPVQPGAVVNNPYTNKNAPKSEAFSAGFFDTIKTLTVIELMKNKDEPKAKVPAPYGGLRVGDAVRKKNGYEFPGVVVALYLTLDRKERAVVELLAEGVGGLQHIFSIEQLEKY